MGSYEIIISIHFDKLSRQVAEQHSERQHEQRSHTVNPISGIVGTLLNLADTQTFEELQRIQRQRKKKHWDRYD